MAQNQDGFLEKQFKLKEHGTNVRTEILAGLTTFITMAYIIFVNPIFLADAGINHQAAITATIIASAFATLLMGLYANFPIALAPGMGVNAFFAYSVVIGMNIPWQTALGAVFISGTIFLLLTITKARQAIIMAVPQSLRSAIAVGIGLFIAFIGFKNAGIVVEAFPGTTLVALGDLSSPAVLVSLFGLVFTGLLISKKIKGSFLIGIVATTIVAMIFQVQTAPPTGLGDLIGTPPSLGPTFGQLDIGAALGLGLITVIFSLTFVDLFDTLGTFMGVTRKAGLMKEDGSVPGMDKALTADSIGTMAGAVIGTSTTTSYIESAAGIEEGGRTGLTAVTTGILFLLALFFAPLVGLVPSIATAPVLILVGIFMMSDVVNIKFDDFTESFPAFLTFILMPLTFSIANGIAVGFTAYAIIKTITGKSKDVGLVMYILMVLFIIQFAFFGH